MKDVLVNVWALLWAIGYTYFVEPVQRWYRRHCHDDAYFNRVGWLIGFMLTIMLLLWGIL